MDCSLTFPNGKTSVMRNLNQGWNIADLIQQLQQRNLLSQADMQQIQSLGLDLQSPIPPVLDLTPQAPTSPINKEDSAVRPTPQTTQRRSGLTRRAPAETPQLNSTGGGLKKKTNSRSPKKGGLKKREPKSPVRPPTPVPNPNPNPNAKTVIIQPPKVVSGRKTYTIDMLCSQNKAEWYATLLGETEPSQSKPSKPATAPTSSGYGTIHIVLDDSGSMSGDANRQLKSATRSFLKDRPKSDSIHLTVLSQRWSEHGSPQGVLRSVDRVGADWGTPMKARFEALANEVSAGKGGEGDVVVFFTDGGSTDGSPVAAANHLKQALGARIICIGCGSGVKESVLQRMASSKSDYHHANNASGILQAFQAVAQSLAQQAPTLVAGGKNTGGSVAKQVASDAGRAPSDGGSNYTSTSKLGDDYGFEVIKNFSCHHCQNDIRTFCPTCQVAQCAGAARSIPDPQGTGKQLLAMHCGSCSTEFHITMVKKLHQSSTQTGKKKGK